MHVMCPALLVGVHVCLMRLHPFCMPSLCCCLQAVQSLRKHGEGSWRTAQLSTNHWQLHSATLSKNLLRTSILDTVQIMSAVSTYD